MQLISLTVKTRRGVTVNEVELIDVNDIVGPITESGGDSVFTLREGKKDSPGVTYLTEYIVDEDIAAIQAISSNMFAVNVLTAKGRDVIGNPLMAFFVPFVVGTVRPLNAGSEFFYSISTDPDMVLYTVVQDPANILDQSQSGTGVTQAELDAEIAAREAADIALSDRTTILENNEIKILYYETVNTASGTITKPTNSTIILNDFPAGIDAVVETIVNGEPSGVTPTTSGGAAITVSSLDTAGNYTLSGTPTDPIAFLYIIKVKSIDYANVNFDNIIEATNDSDGTGGRLAFFTWKYLTNTSATDPGNGNFKANNISAPSITKLYIDDITSGNQVDISNHFARVKDNWAIYIQQRNDASKWVQFRTSTPYLDNTGWWTLDVVYEQSGSGGSLTNLTDCFFSFVNQNSGANSSETRVAVNDTNLTMTTVDNQLIAYTAITANRTVTLPPANVANQRIWILDESNLASGSRMIIVVPFAGDTIGGGTFTVINFPGGSGYLESAGNGNWYIMSTLSVQLSAGVNTLPTLTDNGDGSVTLGNGGVYTMFANANGTGRPKSFPINGGVFALTDLVTNYITAQYNTTAGTVSLVTLTSDATINHTTIIPVFKIYRDGTTVHIKNYDTLATALSNKIQRSFEKTEQYRFEPGGVLLGETAGRIITIASGTVWNGAIEIPLASVASNVQNCYQFVNTAGTWSKTLVTQYNNTQYNAVGGLTTLTNNRYAVNFVYRSVGDDTDMAFVLGTGDYTLGQAQVSPIPTNLPAFITSHMALVGRMIIQKSAIITTQIDKVGDNSIFTTAGVTDHNALTNLQLAAPGVTYGHVSDSSPLSVYDINYWKTVAGTPVRVGNTSFTITDTANANLYDLKYSRTTILKWTDAGVTKMAMVVNTAYAANNVTVTIIGDTLTATATMSTMTYSHEKCKPVILAIAGTMATGTDLTGRYNVPCMMKIFGADGYHTTAGTTNATTYDINLNGTTFMTTKLSIASAATSGLGFTADSGTVTGSPNAGAQSISVDCDSVSTTAPVDAYIELFMMPLNNQYL